MGRTGRLSLPEAVDCSPTIAEVPRNRQWEGGWQLEGRVEKTEICEMEAILFLNPLP